MIYSDFLSKNISLLGFGAMRLPTDADGGIDYAATEKMIDTAIARGVNYFDTAWPYHSGESERVVGKILSKYPRESYFLADKYPGHQILSSYNPAEIFERQLEKCGVEYFDFYLLHNVFENSINTYLDPKWGIIDYFVRQKELGRIKHLGFSSHAELPTLTRFLDICGDRMEFCQIQLNYLDWTLQKAKEKYELLTERGIPVIVMEPVRGGKLAHFDEKYEQHLKEIRPDSSVASWGFRFLQGLDNVKVILSGMSSFEQTIDNLSTFESRQPLSEPETNLLFDIAESLKGSVPCTECRYCCEGCPKGLDIPRFIGIYNELRYAPVTNTAMRIEFMPEEQKPFACIGCGECARLCPQGIDIPSVMAGLCDTLKKIPSWEQICYEREQAQKGEV